MAVTPLVVSHNIGALNEEQTAQEYTFERYLYPEFYDSYNDDVITNAIEQSNDYVSIDNVVEEPIQPLDGPMDSAWPMHNYDARHTGQSPYNTTEVMDEIWYIKDEIYFMHSSPVIAKDGTIYCGALNIYAVNPNGTVKWTFDTNGYIWSAPAINENGIIYVGTIYGSNFYAFYPNGTLKWKIGSGNSHSSPAIGKDGIIYYCDESSSGLKAIYPNNGTRKWIYHCNHLTMSSPAIGLDGTIYFGSIDNMVYAINPNGTLKWKFNTGTWVHGSASIDNDGTVYIGSDTSFYALYPNNGTIKWKLGTGPIWCTPVIDKDGIIYVGSWYGDLYAIYPNGTIKWTFDTGGCFWFGTSPARSAEETIYFGTNSASGGSSRFFALYSDGTEKWCKKGLGWFYSSPAIGENGVVYACSCKDEEKAGSIYSKGYLYSFGKLNPNSPTAPDINGQTIGVRRTKYDYKLKSLSPLDRDVYYCVEWGDRKNTGWLGPYNSGEEVTVSHSWDSCKTFYIQVRVKDSENLWGPWGELFVTIEKNKDISISPLLRFLERYPLLNRLLNLENKF